MKVIEHLNEPGRRVDRLTAGILHSRLVQAALMMLAIFQGMVASANERPHEQVRVWTAVDGRQIEGRAVRTENDDVILSVEGREFRVAKDRLSLEDQLWLRREGRQVPYHRIITQEDIKPLDAERSARMIKTPGEPNRDWLLRPGQTMPGRLIGVDGKDLVIQPVQSNRPVVFVRPHWAEDDMRYVHRVRPPEGRLDEFPGAGPEAEALSVMGLKGLEYHLQSYLTYKSPPPGVRTSICFRWFTPELEHGRQYPLVLFLHGIGEHGQDNVTQLNHRDPLALIDRDNQRRHPCFFMAPQHAPGEDWGGGDSFHVPNQVLRATLEAMRYMQLVEHADQIDWSRIYVTGLSSGGHGAYIALALYPEWFAAAVPVAASTNPKRFNRDNARPIWVFLNRGDDPAVMHNTNLLERHMRDLGQPLRKTVFDGRGHNAWREAYDLGGLARWLFDKQQPPR